MQQLRRHAISRAFSSPATLQSAVDRLGFVQADPIRAPATAQDLILRHRVQDYRMGDLARHYPSLTIEEGALYAYGFLPRDIWLLRQHARDPATLPEMEQAVLAAVREGGPMHPKDLEAKLGSERVVNAWGGYSKASTRALERLQRHGLLRVVRRENGIRVYEAAAEPSRDRMPEIDRFRRLVLVEAGIMAPVQEKALSGLISGLRRISFPEVTNHRNVIRDLLRGGELEQRTVDGISYVWPATSVAPEELSRSVRFLAPFDPLVWDRGRFEHFWGWTYRFEAYTPQAKRVRGYYALPLLWDERVIGWANASVTGGKVAVGLGFVEKRPTDREFRSELDAEIARLEAFLDVQGSAGALTAQDFSDPLASSREPLAST